MEKIVIITMIFVWVIILSTTILDRVMKRFIIANFVKNVNDKRALIEIVSFISSVIIVGVIMALIVILII